MLNDKPANLPRPPLCLDCAKPMRFASAERDRNQANLRRVIYVCESGRTSAQIVVDIA